MNKRIVLAVIAAFILSGCTYYTCPTYAVSGEEAKEERPDFNESNI